MLKASKEILSQKGSNPLSEWKISSSKQTSSKIPKVLREYDRSIKGLCYILDGTATITSQNLKIYNPVLVAQILYPELGHNVNLEVMISDTRNVKHKIWLSNLIKTPKYDPLHSTIPLEIQKSQWTNILVNVQYIAKQLGIEWEYTVNVKLGGTFLLRKIFALYSETIPIEYDYPGFKTLIVMLKQESSDKSDKEKVRKQPIKYPRDGKEKVERKVNAKPSSIQTEVDLYDPLTYYSESSMEDTSSAVKEWNKVSWSN